MSSLSWYKILILGEAKLICLSTGPTDPILSKSKNIILQSFSLSIISKFSAFWQKKKKKTSQRKLGQIKSVTYPTKMTCWLCQCQEGKETLMMLLIFLSALFYYEL